MQLAQHGGQTMTKEIPLTRGYVALVDDDDFDRVAARHWYASSGRGGPIYAITSVGNAKISLHRFILSARPGSYVDHKNRNGLDCRKENLRFCTPSQNSANRVLDPGKTSAYRGVRWKPREGMWAAEIGRRTWLGYFDTEEAAARARDEVARKLYGEFAVLNFPVAKGPRLLLGSSNFTAERP